MLCPFLAPYPSKVRVEIFVDEFEKIGVHCLNGCVSFVSLEELAEVVVELKDRSPLVVCNTLRYYEQDLSDFLSRERLREVKYKSRILAKHTITMTTKLFRRSHQRSGSLTWSQDFELTRELQLRCSKFQ